MQNLWNAAAILQNLLQLRRVADSEQGFFDRVEVVIGNIWSFDGVYRTLLSLGLPRRVGIVRPSRQHVDPQQQDRLRPYKVTRKGLRSEAKLGDDRELQMGDLGIGNHQKMLAVEKDQMTHPQCQSDQIDKRKLRLFEKSDRHHSPACSLSCRLGKPNNERGINGC